VAHTGGDKDFSGVVYDAVKTNNLQRY